MRADTVVMTEATIPNVDQILSRVVRPDGRVGGLQFASGQTVHVITYLSNEEEPEN